ncbi:MAG: hypothetical protein FJZ00_07155, partial [Candidatus Sericytochromatia bacterium]|nr:hypothetical protein [Candidatus Tanganyikabacteria bacterium]
MAVERAKATFTPGFVPAPYFGEVGAPLVDVPLKNFGDGVPLKKFGETG